MRLHLRRDLPGELRQRWIVAAPRVVLMKLQRFLMGRDLLLPVEFVEAFRRCRLELIDQRLAARPVWRAG